MRRRKFLLQLAGGGWAVGTIGCSGCGTILHNERVGQPHSRDIDWKVAGLNALGLVFFFVPGVIAFVVDFSTGAIYLPPEYPVSYPAAVADCPPPRHSSQPSTAVPQRVRQSADRQGVCSGELQRVLVPRGELQPNHIEHVVSLQVGRRMSLLDAHTRVSNLSQLQRFAEQWRHHHDDDRFGMTARTFFAPFVWG